MAVRKEFPRIFHLPSPSVPRWQILIDFKNSLETYWKTGKVCSRDRLLRGKSLGNWGAKNENLISFHSINFQIYFSAFHIRLVVPRPPECLPPRLFTRLAYLKSLPDFRGNQRFKVLLLISLIIIFVCIAVWIDSFINLIPSHVMNFVLFPLPLRKGISWPKNFVFVRP